MEKLVIDRQKWLRGEGAHKSRLYRPEDGKMCCLGMLCLSRGIPQEHIHNLASPVSMVNVYQQDLAAVSDLVTMDDDFEDKKIRYDSTLEAVFLMQANDDERLTEEDRESKLKENFAKLNIDAQFIN